MKNNTKLTFKIYWQHASRYPWRLLAIVITTIAGALSTVVVPLYLQKFFNVLTAGTGNVNAFGQLLYQLSYIALFLFLEFLFWRFAFWYIIPLETKTMTDLSRTCFNYLHKNSFTYFNNNFVGSITKRVNWFVRAFESLSDKLVFNLIPTLTVLIFAISVLISKNLLLGSIMFFWFVVFMTVNGLLTAYKLKYDIQRSQAESESTAVLADTVTNHANVKLFCGYNREVSLFALVTDKVRKLREKAWVIDWFIHAVQGFFMLVLQVVLFYLAIKLWLNGKFTVGDFVLLQTYVLMIFDRIWNLSNIVRQLYQDLADAEEMTTILNTPHEIQDVPNASALQVKEGQIEFKDVTFSYNQTREVISKFNLLIDSKEKLGVVGPSGAGKTTVIKLILRMFDIADGEILIDGQNIAKVTQESLWGNVSMVPQDPILFHRTLMENIRYGKPDATDDEVYEAAQLANCHQFIMDFPEGYNTYVGERGVKLSGGERQRVAIARAILKNSPILILDEATSSLDSESEKLIQEALDNSMKDKTVIVIAHRLSTIMKMDRIVVIDCGKIIEEGNHGKLLKKKNGIYKKLWNVQAGGFIE